MESFVLSTENFNRSHNVRFDSAHQMALDPIVLLADRLRICDRTSE